MKSILKIYYVIIPLLILGITFGFTSFPITLLALLPLLFTTSRHTIGFFFVMYGGPLGGCIRAMYPVLPIYGLLLQLIGFMLMRDLIFDLLKHNVRAIWGMVFVLAFFGVFFMLGPRDTFAQEKYFTMCTNGLLMVLGYYAFDRSTKIDAEALARILLVSALCMYAFSISFYRMSPGGLLDYNWFRDQCMAWFYSQGHEHLIVGYQQVGMLIAFAVSIFFSQTKLSKEKVLFYVVCATQMVMVSGCRQAALAVAVVVGLRYTVFRTANIGRKMSVIRVFCELLGLAVAGVIIYVLFVNSGSDMISKTFEEGDRGRQLAYLDALSIFQANPLKGAGIGGFHAITGEGWPHNFILEMLCETGMVGTIGMLLIVIYVLSTKHVKLLYTTSSEMFFFLVLITLVVRVMVSSDLPESIELFSAIFAVGTSSEVTKRMIANKELGKNN